MSNLRGITRRGVLTGLAAAGVSACDSLQPNTGFLGAMEHWNERVERLLFRAGSMPPTYAPGDETALRNIPNYFVSMRMPIADAGWALRVGGLVARPGMFSLSDVQRMSRRDIRVEHHCVEGWSAVASWHGVALRDLAERVGVDPRAQYVEFRSFDAGYSSCWDRESAFHADTLLAYGMHGLPLTPEHGAPLRVYSPTKLGYKNVKYLTEVNFLPTRTGGYWEDRGYEWYGGV